MRGLVRGGPKFGWLLASVLTALSLGAAGKSGAAEDDNILGLPDLAVSQGGALVICGGGDLPAEVYERFVELAGGKNARIVVIPTAYPFDDLKQATDYYSEWFDLDVEGVEFLHTESSKEADTEEFAEPLTRATGVWLEGGVQGRLADIFRGTRTATEIKRVLERGGVVGGTSAGASIMSQVMIRHGSRHEAVTDDGWGLVQKAVIDQHFIIRDREKRLLGVLSRHPDQIGLGIDEGTALIVQGSHLHVLGQSKVVVCLSENDDEPEQLCRLGKGDSARLMSRLSTDQRPARIEVRRQSRVSVK